MDDSDFHHQAEEACYVVVQKPDIKESGFPCYQVTNSTIRRKIPGLLEPYMKLINLIPDIPISNYC